MVFPYHIDRNFGPERINPFHALDKLSKVFVSIVRKIESEAVCHFGRMDAQLRRIFLLSDIGILEYITDPIESVRRTNYVEQNAYTLIC